ncbi:MAG: N-acetylmuramoyl-L-alanine amidase-like domain-containing protein [Blastocatellia bacterium]
MQKTTASLLDNLPPADKRLAGRLLKKAAREINVPARMRVISGALLGHPYMINPLIGSATETEVFQPALAGFDCVTYVETVTALALASSVEEYLLLLREIRYVHGEVVWKRRHHYTVDWARHNVRRGFLGNVTRGAEAVNRRKTLDLIRALSPRIVSFDYFPKRRLKHVTELFADGDLIFFVSTRRGLDVFHTGILMREGDAWRMRHAARSRGGVVEQDLCEFIAANRMPGFFVVRPRAVSRAEIENLKNAHTPDLHAHNAFSSAAQRAMESHNQ